MGDVSKLEKPLINALEIMVKAGRCTWDELGKFDQQELQTLALGTMEYLETGESPTIKTIQAADYAFEIPDVVTMVENPYYLGNELGRLDGPHGKRQIYDYWVEQLINIDKGNYIQVLITGAIGLGKTTMVNVLCYRDLMKIMALKNPQRHYNLMPSTKIIFAFFNILKDLAGDVGYAQFQAMLENSPFMRQILNYNTKRREGFRMEPDPKKRIGFKVGSRVSHTLGIAVFFAGMDEANFGTTKTDSDGELKKAQVYKNYTSLVRRKESRFPTAAGHFVIASSKREESDFLEQHIEQSKGKSDVYIIDAAQYTVKKCRGDYSGKTFRVLLGDTTRESRILKDNEIVPKELEHAIEVIPIEHKNAYEIDIVEALRDISGKAMGHQKAFIPNRDAIRLLFDPNKKPLWRYNSSKSIPNTITISFHGTDMIQDYIEQDYFKKLPYPDSPRFIAIDTGYATDANTIAMGCKAGAKILTQPNGQKVFLQQYHTDFTIRIKGKSKEQYPLYKNREFIKWLIGKQKVFVAGFSVDGFQSVQMQQEIEVMFPYMDVEQVSMDKTDIHYIEYRNLLYAGQLLPLPMNQNLSVELADLLHINVGKAGTRGRMIQMAVDHPRVASDGNIGRKDEADAHCAMISKCRRTDVAVSKEEAHEQIKELASVDIDGIVKDAEAKADAALKEIDNLNLDKILGK